MLEQTRADVSAEIAAIPVSGIRELMNAAWDVPGAILLAAGQPNFPTPPHVVQAATDAALAGKTEYVSDAGIPELRAALAEKIRRVNGYEVTPANVIVSAGGGEGIFATLAALLAPGDGILLPDPGWPNFAMGAGMLRARTLFYPLDASNDYLPEIADLERLCDERTKVLLINSPSNPLGTVIPRERMRELAAFAERRGLWLVSDECYDEIVFDDGFVSAAAVADPDRTIAIYTFSKTYAMTGWRVGYVAAPLRVTAQLAKLQEPLISCVNTPAQYAALAALNGPQAIVEEHAVGVPRAARRGLRAARARRRHRAGPQRRVLRLGRRARRRAAQPRLRAAPAARARRRGRAGQRVRRAGRGLRAHLAGHRAGRALRGHGPARRGAGVRATRSSSRRSRARSRRRSCAPR